MLKAAVGVLALATPVTANGRATASSAPLSRVMFIPPQWTRYLARA